MNLPQLTIDNSVAKQSIINFLGLNYGRLTTDGELEDCENLSTDQFPCLSQRKSRKQIKQYKSPTTLFSKSGLFVIDGTDVYYKDEKIGTVTEGKKQMAALGKYVVIFPDKKYYDTEEKKFASMEEVYTSKAGQITFAATSSDPDDPIKYATITTTGADFNFKKGDAVEITGCTVNPENNKTLVIREVENKVLKFYENSFTSGKETAAITIKRSVPDLEFVCESNYRLWGCAKNTIYSSKYGDPLNFQVFDGLTSDSYYIDVSSDGNFTGCIPFTSFICFFKEDVVHKIYGTKPSNFQVLTSNVFGVQAGCERSMCVVNETLYYLGRNGVYSYTGGVPELISQNFGTKRFINGCAGSDGNKYYISMSSGPETAIYTYDIEKGIWLKEDKVSVIDFADIEGELYYIDEQGWQYKVADDNTYEVIKWSATFCPFTELINERKGYSKLNFRIELAQSAWLKIEVKTDNNLWQTVYTTHNEYAKTINIPIYPNRCDKFKVRLSGEGSCVIQSFIRDFYVGSEV